MNAWKALALIDKNDQHVWIGHSPEETTKYRRQSKADLKRAIANGQL